MIHQDQAVRAVSAAVVPVRRSVRPESDLDQVDEESALVITVDGPDDVGRAAVVVIGEIDYDTSPVLLTQLLSWLIEPGLRELLLDLSGVTFLNAGGLAALADVRRQATKAAVRLVLRCSGQRAVLRP